MYFFCFFLFSVFFFCSYKQCNWLARVCSAFPLYCHWLHCLLLLAVPSLLCVRILSRPGLAVCTHRACVSTTKNLHGHHLIDFVGVDGQKDLIMRTYSGASRAVQCVITYTKNSSTAVLTVGINTHSIRNKSRVHKIYQVGLVCVSFCNHRDRRSQAFGRRKTVSSHCGGWQRVPASN